jgi:S-adenosylmethionine:tRNA ribosyltransferase-isomerase
MPTPISQFDYDLQSDLIAQHSVEPRDHSKLMVLDRITGEIQHKHFYNILDALQVGDVLVFNDTKVFRARLNGYVIGGVPRPRMLVEVFLLRCVREERSQEEKKSRSFWNALLRHGKKVQIGDVIQIDNLEVVVRDKQNDGVALLEFPIAEVEVFAFTDTHGSIPIPPYVKEIPTDAEKYQTVYARDVGSVAAPTAGFHFTNELLDRIRSKGVEITFVTLHVGLGTFRPVQTETIEEHVMHSEVVSISKETAEQINRAKFEGRRVIAVGTTTVRSLEGVARLCHYEESSTCCLVRVSRAT